MLQLLLMVGAQAAEQLGVPPLMLGATTTTTTGEGHGRGQGHGQGHGRMCLDFVCYC